MMPPRSLILVAALSLAGCRVERGVGLGLSVDTGGRVGVEASADFSVRVGNGPQAGPSGEFGVGVLLAPFTLHAFVSGGGDFFTDHSDADDSNWHIGPRARGDLAILGADQGAWGLSLGIIGFVAHTITSGMPDYCPPRRQEAGAELGVFAQLRRHRLAGARLAIGGRYDWIGRSVCGHDCPSRGRDHAEQTSR